MKLTLGYVFVFVPDVPEALDFYQRAFGLPTRYRDSDGMFGEVETGATVLAFASDGYVVEASGVQHRLNALSSAPAGVSLTLIADDVPSAWVRAVEAGATVIAEPAAKPWGQTVGYLRDLNGVLVEIASTVEY